MILLIIKFSVKEISNNRERLQQKTGTSRCLPLCLPCKLKEPQARKKTKASLLLTMRTKDDLSLYFLPEKNLYKFIDYTENFFV